ncbi:MAG: M3 family peptidase, partial [Pseudomonadota bacterium]|nr:M3 family peptidase [Pseudomonadota bacterium]
MTAKTYLLGGAAAFALLLAGCAAEQASSDDASADTAAAATDASDATSPAMDEAALAENPLLQTWDTPYGVPPFAEIEDEDYLPAIDVAIAELEAEIDAIANNPEPATFENTIVALDRAGGLLSQVALTFSNITNTDTNDTLADLETQIWPKVTAVNNAISFNETLFERVKAVKDAAPTLDLDE